MKAKQFLSLLLCAALLCTLLPTTVLAEEPSPARDSGGFPVQDSGEPLELSIGVSNITESGAEAAFTTNTDGTVYYAIYQSGEDAPDEAALLAGETVTATTGSAIIVSVDGLAAQTGYTVYGLLENAAGSRSAVRSAQFTTGAESVAAPLGARLSSVSADGNGTMTVVPDVATAGQSSQSLSFTYTAGQRGW